MLKKLKLGIALESGSARGWSRIGILNALAEQEIYLGIVYGISIGALVDAIADVVWASISLLGLFSVINNAGRWLVDGGLVNPVLVSVCKALGADVVIAVNLNGDLVGRHFDHTKRDEKTANGFSSKTASLVKEYTGSLLADTKSDQQPGLFDAVAGSVNIIQDRITKSRLAGDPPDILLAPKLSQIGLLEFYRASEAIDEGQRCVQRALPDIKAALGIVV